MSDKPPSSRPSTGAKPATINETIHVICRLRPLLPMDTAGGSSPRYDDRAGDSGAGTFITPESMQGGDTSYESHVASFSPEGDLVYSKNYGEEMKSFKFSGCVGPEVDQGTLYDDRVKDIVSGVMDGEWVWLVWRWGVRELIMGGHWGLDKATSRGAWREALNLIPPLLSPQATTARF